MSPYTLYTYTLYTLYTYSIHNIHYIHIHYILYIHTYLHYITLIIHNCYLGRHDVKPRSNGAYFIDRDPFTFRHVLNYLRGEKIMVEVLSKAERLQLLSDTEFYNLPGLQMIIK